MLHTHDMTQVADAGEVPDTGSYLLRIAEVKETDESGNPLLSGKGEPKVVFICKVQDEGKFFGFPIQIHASLQAHALATLKAIYTACGYMPGPEGHDPQQVLDGEFYAWVEKKPYIDPKDNSEKVGSNIAPWNITSLQKGPKILRS